MERIPKYDSTLSSALSDLSLTSRSYRCGLSGDHSLGLRTGRRSSLPIGPRTVATTLRPSLAVTVAVPFEPWTVTYRAWPRRSGVVSTRSMWSLATGSIQTVCQMPDTAVYQMPLGLSRCLPMAWAPSSVGSYTPTTSSCGPERLSAPVTSTLIRP